MNGSERIDADTAEEITRAAAIRSALRRFSARTEAASNDTGISSEHYVLMLMLQAAELAGKPMSVTELADDSTLQQSAVKEFLAGAERAGLIGREQSPTMQGASTLRLTAEGRRRLVAAVHALRGDRGELARTLHGLL